MDAVYLPSHDKAGTEEDAYSYTAMREEGGSLAKTLPTPKPIWADLTMAERRTRAMRIFALDGGMEPEGVDVPTIEVARSQSGLTDHSLQEILKTLWKARLLGWMPLDVHRGGYSYRSLGGHVQKGRSPDAAKASREGYARMMRERAVTA